MTRFLLPKDIILGFMSHLPCDLFSGGLTIASSSLHNWFSKTSGQFNNTILYIFWFFCLQRLRESLYQRVNRLAQLRPSHTSHYIPRCRYYTKGMNRAEADQLAEHSPGTHGVPDSIPSTSRYGSVYQHRDRKMRNSVILGYIVGWGPA